MNREIKFRAWNIQQKRMLNNFYGLVNQLGYDGVCVLTKDVKSICPDPLLYPPDENIIMQYTGLKDKNGKDIYEGDILSICNGSINCFPWMEKNREVKFSKGSFNVPTWDYDSTHWIEVIGNIYENP